MRRMGDHPTNPGPGVREKGWQLGKTLGCRLVVKSWGAPPKSLGRCGSARAQSIFLPSITLGCKNLKHTTQGHSKHG